MKISNKWCTPARNHTFNFKMVTTATTVGRGRKSQRLQPPTTHIYESELPKIAKTYILLRMDCPEHPIPGATFHYRHAYSQVYLINLFYCFLLCDIRLGWRLWTLNSRYMMKWGRTWHNLALSIGYEILLS